MYQNQLNISFELNFLQATTITKTKFDSMQLRIKIDSIIFMRLLPGFISRQLAIPIAHAITKAYFSPIYRVIGFMAIETQNPVAYMMTGINAT